MADSTFEIGAPGIDTARLVEDIRARVAEKLQAGAYTDSRIGWAERFNLSNLKDQDEMLTLYLECLRDGVFVDIGDFEIVERRTFCSGLFIALKRLIWKLLKFYTYRLWSQQNQINGLLLAAIEASDSRNREKIAALEKRIGELEAAASMIRKESAETRSSD